MREIIRDLLLQHPDIKEHVTAFHTYQVPNTTVMQSGIIVYIDPLDIPTPTTYRDGESEEDSHLVQIDVYAPANKRPEWQTVHQKVKEVMTDKNGLRWSLNGGIDQYDTDLKIYRYGQRFVGKYKRSF